MARVQTNDLNPPERLQPAAAPVQRFTSAAPPPEGPNGAQQLAQALANIQPSLTGFLNQRSEQYIQEEADKARKARLSLALTYQDAVKQGKIAPQQSPFFIRAYKEADGRVAADQYNQDLMVGLATGPMAETLDPQESDKLLTEFRKNWMDQHQIANQSPEFLDAFSRQANAYESNARTTQAEIIGHRIVERAKNNLFFEVENALDEMHQRDLSPDAAAEGINSLLNRGIFVGMDPKELNSIVLSAAFAKGLETQNPLLIKSVMDKVKTGSGYLGKTYAATEKFDELSRQLAEQQHQNDSWAHQKEQWDREAKTLTTSSAIVKTIVKNRLEGKPTNPKDVAAQLLVLSDVDPTLYTAMNSMLKTSKEDVLSDKEDIGVSNHFFDTLYSTGKLNRTSVIQAHMQGLISERTMTDLLDREDRIQQEAINRYRSTVEFNQGQIRFQQQQQEHALNLVTNNPFVQQEIANIHRAFSQEGQQFDGSKALREGQAVNEFLKTMDDFVHDNPKVDAQTLMKKIRSVGLDVVDPVTGFGDNSMTSSSGKSARDVINTAVGIQGGRFAPVPDSPEGVAFHRLQMQQAQDLGSVPQFKGGYADFHAAMDEYIQSKGTKGRLAEMLGNLPPDAVQAFLDAQSKLYPEPVVPQATEPPSTLSRIWQEWQRANALYPAPSVEDIEHMTERAKAQMLDNLVKTFHKTKK